MNAWQDILATRGAVWRDGELVQFEERPGGTSDACMAPLLNQESLLCTGDGAAKLLHGQLTCDVLALSDQACTLGACCTPKGRMVANFRLFQRSNAYRFHLPTGQGPLLREALAKYLPFYKCELDKIEGWLGVGCWGQDMPAMLRAAGLHVPDCINHVAAYGDGFIARVHGVQPRFELWLPAPEMESIWDQLRDGCTPCSDQAWMLQEIRAGVGWITPELSEALVPQMLNLQHLDAISFKKGCYTGQEIVARMQYRGSLKKCAFRFSCADDGTEALPGVSICTALGEATAGEVIQSARDGNQLELLAVVRVADVEHGPLYLAVPDGPELTRRELPYSPITD